MCDQEGNLLFYTNGCYIADRNDQLMMNGDSLNLGFFYSYHCSEDNGYRATQNILIIPQPDQAGIYFIFHQRMNLTDEAELIIDRLLYTVVDMNLNNGLGAVVEKNVPAISEVLYPGHLTAVKHANGVDWWIICAKRKSNVYFSLLLTAQGVEGPFEQTIGKVTTKEGEGSGQACFSPDGGKYVRYNKAEHVFYMEFDREQGLLSNFRKFTLHLGNAEPGGVAFSPSSQYLYLTNFGKVFQFDTNVDPGEIFDTKQVVAEYDGFANPLPTRLFLAQLAPDCKIYINATNSARYLHVIHKPDLPGVQCDLRQHDLMLPTYNFLALPNFPNYRLGAEPSLPCEPVSASQEPLPEVSETIQLFPNPAQGIISIRTPNLREGHFRLINTVGQLAYQALLTGTDHEIALPLLAGGIYFYEIWDRGKVLGQGKLVVE